MKSQNNNLYAPLLFLISLLLFGVSLVNGQSKVNKRIDCMRYWVELAKKGLVEFNPDVTPPPAKYSSDFIMSPGIIASNSPDVLIVEDDQTTQSENSVFANPVNSGNVINSNNSTGETGNILYGTDAFVSTDQGENWTGNIEGTTENTFCDPATAINRSGRMFVGYVSQDYGQGISYSDNNGVSWTHVDVAPNYANLLDKNHLWIDNSQSSPHMNNIYSAWTTFGWDSPLPVELSRSTDNGLTWSDPINISSNVNALDFNHGVNLQTGPNGEVYAVWAIYDDYFESENAIGFARSLNSGGEVFEPAQRIISNIKGIRYEGTSKDMRVNSFPVMAVDISGGPNSGNLYVVWTNKGIPGINTGNDIDIYMIRSIDQGTTWSVPVRVNQDRSGLGKQHYMPWITCDPSNGNLHVVFYDDRNVNNTEVEVFVASSFDGGNTWEDFRVSDVAFTPTPIPDLADGYFGDYIGITAKDNIVYPVWTDNRTGDALAYCSPFVVGCIEDNWLVNSTIAIGETITEEASNSITVAGDGNNFIIEGNGSTGGEAIFHAGNLVNMKKGFHAQKGCHFYGSLAGCSGMNSFLSEEFTEKSADKEINSDENRQGRGDADYIIYPNPNSGKFKVELINCRNNIFAFSVFDLMGKLVYQQHITNPVFDIDLSDSPKGIYIVKLFDRNNNMVRKDKILIR